MVENETRIIILEKILKDDNYNMAALEDVKKGLLEENKINYSDFEEKYIIYLKEQVKNIYRRFL